MEIVYNEAELTRYMTEAVKVSNDSPVLLDHFLNAAIEVDIDLVCDGEQVLVGGIMQHIEQAGVHSGDSACSLPPYSLSQEKQEEIREQARQLAKALNVVGLMNAQFAVQDDTVYIIEVNPRGSRTVPFVSKATGLPLAKIAARVMAGKSLAEQGITTEVIPDYYSVKEAVFPFVKFPGIDPILGPEMKSTGEVMGVGRDFAEAFAKASLGAGVTLPSGGTAFVSVRDADKPGAIDVAKKLQALGFRVVATRGTAAALQAAGVECDLVNKVTQGRPHIVDMIKNDEINLIINTTEGTQAILHSGAIRSNALQHKVTYTTTLAGAEAMCLAMKEGGSTVVNRLQDLHQEMGQ
jgi:carbamoyl-phosphate synthase large subunit